MDDLAPLRTFVTVVRAGSVTIAARDLHLSQASVSRHLQRLEAEIGTPLFRRRDGRRLEPTEAAVRILGPAAELLAAADERWDRLRDLASAHPQRLAVALGPMVTSMPETVETLRRFHAEHPDVALRVTEEPSTDAAIRGLRSGEYDLAIRGLRPADAAGDLEIEPLARMHLHAVVRKDHALAELPTIAPTDIAGARFVFRRGGDAVRDFLAVCAEAGIDPDIPHLVEDPAAAIRLLTAGDAITVAWAPVNRAPGPLAYSFRLVPLHVDTPTAMLSACWLRSRPLTLPARDLVAYAHELLRSWAGEPIQN